MAETDIGEMTTALRSEGIEYRVNDPGTTIASIVVTGRDGNELAAGPSHAQGDEDADGIDIGFYNGTVEDGQFGSNTWVGTVAEFVTEVREFLDRHDTNPDGTPGKDGHEPYDPGFAVGHPLASDRWGPRDEPRFE